MDYMKCWVLLKQSLLDSMAVEEEYSSKKYALQSVLNDMAAIEVGITLGGADGERRE